MSTEKLIYTNRWFSYFDLLGFANLVQTSSIEQIMPIYQKVLDKLQVANLESRKWGIYTSWFSDTFIIYSRGNQDKDFVYMEQVSRLFFEQLIRAEIPARGALTHGKLYSQQEQNIFVGPALIEAYKYGEGQDWLGFLLTPSAIEHMKNISLPVNERFAYREVTKSRVLKSNLEGPVYAFAFNNLKINKKNPYLKALQSMKTKAGSEHSQKYESTIQFLRNAS